MSSFQGVGIEEFHCIQRCPHFTVLGIEEFHCILISGCWNRGVYRGVLISGCWNRGVPLYTEVSSFQGVGIEDTVYYMVGKGISHTLKLHL